MIFIITIFNSSDQLSFAEIKLSLFYCDLFIINFHFFLEENPMKIHVSVTFVMPRIDVN